MPWVFSTRHDGDIRTAAGRERLARLVGVTPSALVTMNQVHGASVSMVEVPEGAPGRPPVADALVTRSSAVVLAVAVADCVPLVLADDDHGVVAAVHVGRRGLVAGVVAAAMAAVRVRGAGSSSVRAVLGPSICGRCYEVPVSLRAEVVDRVPQSFAVTRAGTPAVDIPAGVVAQLAAEGVDRVVRSPVCTFEDDDYNSYRRDGTSSRQAGLVWLR